MKDNSDNSDQNKNLLKDYAPYLGLGLQLAITIVVMFFLGIWLDEKFDTSPILTIIFSCFGIFAALFNFIKSVLKSDK